jgi:TfoX/Sxy family transcriptional regulator of competence genes
MAYNETLVDRIREALMEVPLVHEKHMFGGVVFMVDDKMCVGVVKDDLMCRLDPDRVEELLEYRGCRPMDFTGKRMKGYVYVDETGMSTLDDFHFWINECIAFNPRAKKSKK